MIDGVCSQSVTLQTRSPSSSERPTSSFGKGATYHEVGRELEGEARSLFEVGEPCLGALAKEALPMV
jgi:hypothetical protein